ncbi:DUF2799 domain-containing protein [Pseudazoarcus pumilus]|uniref:DUF2799 domain-containing protein n=1 Tax=Pseudazoarcus pumilus TaxID=2067960 RepID=A0A2I6S3C7_9RHOO|nr:DUF2799 domain-containing protein [Pseudazoarcus pumilus]AUN93766.1 hypothetical protein C0099_01720 [Pseudazoarcus pumilus]
MRTALPAALIAALIAGCATIPAEECARTDWHALGMADGRDGHPPSRIERHAEACAQVGIAPDEAAWEAGRRLGLPEYCRLPNAIEHGLAGKRYAGVCDDADFARLHDAARQLADTRREIESVDRDLAWRERQLATSTKLDERDRARLWIDIRALERKRDRLRDDRIDATLRLDRLSRELGL